MNYYIQGSAARAEQIKAAFEKLGYRSTYVFNAEMTLYFTFNGEIKTAVANSYKSIIKTHPDYKELELPIEPKFKFKVGDWIVQNDNGTVSQITKTINGKDEYGEYRAYEHTNGYFAACFENEYHLWTIKDAKDGDVLANDHHILILKELVYDWSSNGTPYSVKAYCGIKPNGNFEIGKDNWCFCGTLHIHPATKEQHDLLFAKMKEAGYQWNVDKKELRKIQPHYDISNFKPFDKVLVRDADDGKWRCNWFSHYSGDGGVYRFVTTKCGYAQCIPFESNEHLLGTTYMPSEEFINW